MWHSRSATEGSRPRASHLGYRPQNSVEFVVSDGQGSVEVVLQVGGQPRHRVPAAALEQVYAHPLSSHIEPEALAYVEVHGFHFGQILADAPWQAPEPERFTGREELVKEVVEIGDWPAETEGNRRSEGARASLG